MGEFSMHRARRPRARRHHQPAGGDERAAPAGATSSWREVFDDFAADPELWVAIVTGAGDRAFSRRQRPEAPGRRRRHGEPAGAGFGGLTARFDLTKPLIAAVNGVAMGGGFEIALACDIIIASENAVFALPEPRVGLAALAGGLHRLPRADRHQAGDGHDPHRAPRVAPQEGKELGFVNEVVPEGQAVGRGAQRWAEMILECSPMSVRASKQAVYQGLEQPACRRPSASKYAGGRARMCRSRGLRGGPAGVRREAPAAVEGPLSPRGRARGSGPTAAEPAGRANGR